VLTVSDTESTLRAIPGGPGLYTGGLRRIERVSWGQGVLVLGITGEDQESHLRSLYQWLLSDRSVRRDINVTLGSSMPPSPGSQGTVVDIISLVLGSTFNAGSLAFSLAAWRESRSDRPVVTVERPDGVKISITQNSSTEVQRILSELLGHQD
jgi:hypothetical protein